MPYVHTPRASHSQEQMHSKNFEVYLFVLEAYFIFNKMDIYHLPRHCVSHVSSGIVVCFPTDHMLVRQLHRQAQAHYPAMVQEIGYSKESGCLNSSWNVTESLSPVPLNCCVHFVILLPTKPSGSFHKTTEVFNTFEKLLWVLKAKVLNSLWGSRSSWHQSDGPEGYTCPVRLQCCGPFWWSGLGITNR